jgi:MoxR-like ATPase
MKLQPVRDELSRCLIERDEQIEMLLLGLLSGQNVCFVGPPGTAKSLMVDSLGKCIAGADYFNTLMHKFVPPDELVGQLMLSELKKDRYQRMVDGFAPTADLVFLDEIWKSSPALLNTLLRLLNEKQFRNGAVMLDCPMWFCASASNEWPIGEGFETTEALFDRFLIRGTVRPISDSSRERLWLDDLPTPGYVVDKAEVDEAIAFSSGLTFCDDAVQCLHEIYDALSAEGILIGDRRQRSAINVCQAACYLDDDLDCVKRHHLECLKHVLWTDPVEHPAVVATVVERLSNPAGAELTSILGEAEEAMEQIGPRFLHGNDIEQSAQRLACLQKLASCRARVETLGMNGRGDKALDYLKQQVETVRQACGL